MSYLTFFFFFPEELTAGLADNEGLISLVKVRRGSISGGGGTSAEVFFFYTTSSGKRKLLRISGCRDLRFNIYLLPYISSPCYRIPFFTNECPYFTAGILQMLI